MFVSDKLVSTLVEQVERHDSGATQLVATSALWALVYNNHKVNNFLVFSIKNYRPRADWGKHFIKKKKLDLKGPKYPENSK